MDRSPKHPRSHLQRVACSALLALLAGLSGAPGGAAELTATATATATVIAEAKLGTLLGDIAPRKRLEASGVVAADGRFYVTFDNTRHIAVLAADGWTTPPIGARILTAAVKAEGITRDPDNAHLYLIEEARRRGNDDKHATLNARLHEYSIDANDDALSEIDDAWLDYNLQARNKGIEGIVIARRDARLYLLALCESNGCERGAVGRTPGNGRIKVFRHRKSGRGWKYVASIDLPRSLAFVDYSGIDLHGDRLVIVSQQTSALWLGTIEHRREGKRELWRVRDDGRTLTLPRTDDGAVLYCNVEGVSWINEHTLVVVSDEAKDDQPERCRTKDQSIHVLRIATQ